MRGSGNIPCDLSIFQLLYRLVELGKTDHCGFEVQFPCQLSSVAARFDVECCHTSAGKVHGLIYISHASDKRALNGLVAEGEC